MAKSKKPTAPGQQRSATTTLPAPYGGWNARDALTAMPPTDAITLENFIPTTTTVTTRMGYSTFATGVGTRCDSLMQYSSPSANKLFAASSGGKIMELVSTSTATNTATDTYSNGKFQHTMIGSGAGNFLVVCNGADVPHFYDGTNWATASITGCTAGSSTFVNVTTHIQRLWFTQINTLDMWYLPVSSVQGAAARIQLAPFCRRGGYLVGVTSWTRDGGAGMDDILVALTSQGEAILWQGTDPTSNTLFQMVGVFNIPIPIGRRCFTQIGADVALITSGGVVPLSDILPLSPGGDGKVAATAKIIGAFQSAYKAGSAFFGWQAIENAREQLLIINVPQVENTTIHQFCMNTLTGAWCRFTNLNAQCWATFGDQLYFGGVDGKVYLYGTSKTDNGTAISAKSASAFTTGGSASIKQFLMARPVVTAPQGLIPGVGIHIDYDTSDIVVVSEPYTVTGSPWNTSPWNTSPWTTGTPVLTAQWQTINGTGVAVSLETQVTTSDTVELNSTDVMYEIGGNL